VGTVQAQANMSLDGYVAKHDNTIGRLFDWLQNGEVAIPAPAGDFTVHLLFGFETLHEGGNPGVLGTDHLDRHLTPNRGLVALMDDAEVALADDLSQLVAPDHPHAWLPVDRSGRAADERRILLEDLTAQHLELG
jgi:hypothetical protein